jgi:UDP-glucose 4-epimerase
LNALYLRPAEPYVRKETIFGGGVIGMTVLITGGAGYIGGHTVLAFLDRGEVPVVLDDLSTGSRDTLPAEVPFFLGDVGDTAFVRQILETHKVDAILHFAAKIVVPESMTDPLGYYLNNTVKTRALLEAAVQAHVGYFVFSSTAAVYGNPSEAMVTEAAVPAPLSPYGKSKLMSEWIIRDVGDAYNQKHAILRYFNVAGADPKGRHGQSTPNATHLIKVAVETALGRRPFMNIFGNDYPTPDGTCVRDYVHVSDLAQAHLFALDDLRRNRFSRTLNCGYGRGYSVREVVEAVRSISGSDFDVRQAPRRSGDPASIVASTEQLRTLGWKPNFDDLSKIVSHALAWEKCLVIRTQTS